MRFGSVRYFCTQYARIRPFYVKAHARYCTWVFFLEDFHAVHCAVGSGLPRADSLDFTMCLGDPFFVIQSQGEMFHAFRTVSQGQLLF